MRVFRFLMKTDFQKLNLRLAILTGNQTYKRPGKILGRGIQSAISKSRTLINTSQSYCHA